MPRGLDLDMDIERIIKLDKVKMMLNGEGEEETL